MNTVDGVRFGRAAGACIDKTRFGFDVVKARSQVLILLGSLLLCNLLSI